MNELKPGEINTLKVDRITDIAYMLTNGVEEEENVFMHFQQAQTELHLDEMVDVFLYYDNQKRTAATTLTPKITIGKPDFVEVVDINDNLGVFVNIGIDKDMLISKDFLPYDLELWPKKGDVLFCELKAKKNRLLAKVVSKDSLDEHLVPDEDLTKGDKVMASPIRIGEEGTSFMTKEGHSIYVYQKHQRTQAKIGEEVEIKITKVMPDFTYYGTLNENITTMMAVDSDVLVNYMKEHNNEMSFTAKTDPVVILEEFKMSKAAFKRALGKLYKLRIIEITDAKIILLDTEE